jgi:hypothetical protein
VIQIQILTVKSFPAVLAGVFVPFENVMPSELHLFFRQMIINHQEDNTWYADSERDGSNRFRMGFLLGKVMPLAKVEGLERSIRTIKDDLCMPLKKQGQSASRGAHINGLPKPIQHQHMLVEYRTHNESNLGKSYTRGYKVSIGAGGCNFSEKAGDER